MPWIDFIRNVPDFPAPGVMFRDIMPVLAHGPALQEVLSALEERIRPAAPEALVAPEARGFLLAAALADRMKIGMVPVRKPGKLPPPVVTERYVLEYGESRLEVPDRSLAGLRVAVVDDVLATGGTVAAAANLVERLGAHVVLYGFLIELKNLNGRERLNLERARVEVLLTL